MTNFQAFYSGFLSAWDFSRPFSEKVNFHSYYTDIEKLREQVGLNEGVWDSVGKYLSNAMSVLDKEIENHVSDAQ
jgi:ABC-type dipeptide/oligopeptide/nickel transport system permease component